MAHVKFTGRFDYRPTRSTWITYKAGEERTDVPRAACDAAVAAGVAKEIKSTRTRKPKP